MGAGRLYIVHTRQRPLALPGLTIIPRPGPTGIDGETELGDGTLLSSPARGLLDNLASRGERYLTTDEIERWIAELLDTAGVERLNAIRDHARRIALALGRERAVNPFADGNGRVARLMMNSELVARAEVRITIPTVYRNNYLAALRGVTHTRNFAGLAATLDFARRYTARSDF